MRTNRSGFRQQANTMQQLSQAPSDDIGQADRPVNPIGRYLMIWAAAVLLASQGASRTIAADCSIDENLAAKIEQVINETLGLPPEAIYLSGPVAQPFFAWDPFLPEDLKAAYGIQMDRLPQPRAVPEKSVMLQSVFQDYGFILANLEVAPATLSSDALNKQREIE